MKKIVLTFGSIAGIICVGMFFLLHPEGAENINYDNGQLLGYITMIVALSSIFFAVKQYRDKHMNGSINFGKSFLIGLYITIVASVIYVFAWEVYSTNFAPDFVDQYFEYTKKEIAKSGMSQEEIEEELSSQLEMIELYKNNTAFRLALTFMEIFPVGLIISLICGLIFGVFGKRRLINDTDR